MEESVDAGRRSEALPKEKRLASRREFLHVYETGRKLYARYAVLFFAPNNLQHSRLGITATKKVGKANVRNKLKRWTREVYRRHADMPALDRAAVDLVVNVKGEARDATFEDYSRDLAGVLSRVTSANRS